MSILGLITYTTTSSSISPIWSILGIVIAVFFIACYWIVFTKAGYPGWGAIIPFFNYYIMMKVAGKPGWWLILLFIPIVNIVVWIIVALATAKAFDKTALFGVGLIFLPFIFIPILAFGSATYQLQPGWNAAK